MEITWEDPPAAAVRAQGRAGKYRAFAEALRDHEGKWALLPASEGEERSDKGAQNTAQNIRRGVIKGFTKDEFEAVSDGGKVYVRFTGAKEPEEKETDPNETDEERAAREAEEAERVQAEADFAPKVRQWAAVKGIPVAERGRLPHGLVRDYCKDTNTPLPKGYIASVS